MLRKTLLIVIIALVSVAGVAAPAGAQGDGQVRGVSEENCTVTPFDIAGQGNFTIDGSSGDIPSGATAEQIIQPDVSDLQLVRSMGPEPVALLVIDDFFEYRDSLAHGRLVADLLTAMIQAHPAYTVEPRQVHDDPVVWTWLPGGENAGQLYLVEVDTENYDTQQLKGFVEDAVTLMQKDYGVSRFVFNMSFSLIPCETPDYNLKTLRAERVPGQTRQVSLISEVSRARELPTDLSRNAESIMTQALTDNPRARQAANVLVDYATRSASVEDESVLDPLHEYIKSLTGEGTYWNTNGDIMAVAIGSAGNFGRHLDSFLPAAWPEVASVSAFIGLDTPWQSSNRGQVMLPGGLFDLGDLYLIGTSFSAPVLSMNMAFYLTNTNLCAGGDGPLKLDTTDFLDLPLAGVVNLACFPPFAAGAPSQRR